MVLNASIVNTALQEEKPKDGQKYNLNMLTDDDLKAALLVYGVKAGPIVGKVAFLFVFLVNLMSTFSAEVGSKNVCLCEAPPGPCMRGS